MKGSRFFLHHAAHDVMKIFLTYIASIVCSLLISTMITFKVNQNNSVLYCLSYQSKGAHFHQMLTKLQLKKSNDYSSLFSTVFLALEYNPEADNPSIPPTNIPCLQSNSVT